MVGDAKNSNLTRAKAAKNNEYYTQWADIEREINAYLDYDPDVFRGKVVLLPCDDPEWSNFTKFFAHHFVSLGLRRLVSTSLAPDVKPVENWRTPALFDLDGPKVDDKKEQHNGKKFVLDVDGNGDGAIDIDDLQWEYLTGTGDYASGEVTALRDEADFIITNPPFSEFRPFLAWAMTGGKKVAVIGTNNAVSYKEVFPLIKANLLWKGATANDTDMVFAVPPGAEISASDRAKAKQMGYDGDYTRLGSACWFTNIEHGRRHQPLQLMTEEDNVRYSKHKILRGRGYEKYDNFDAIEVPFVDAIPSDYEGLMGVPVTFLDKYNPEQFEIVFNADDMEQTKENGVEPLGEKRVADYYAAGGTGGNSKGHRKLFLTRDRPWVPFKRIVIRHRKA